MSVIQVTAHSKFLNIVQVTIAFLNLIVLLGGWVVSHPLLNQVTGSLHLGRGTRLAIQLTAQTKRL